VAGKELVLSQENQPGTHLSQRETARRLQIHPSTVHRIVAKDLNLKSFHKVPVHDLSDANKAQRLEKSRRLLDKLSQRSVGKVVFTDEKNFTLSAPRNSQNDRVYGEGKKRTIHPKRLVRETTHFNRHVMVSAGVSARGKTKLHFVKPGVKINAQYYSNTLLKDGLLPDCRILYPRGDFIFQQDSAPSHTAQTTITLLREQNPAFLTKEDWPAKSPDLNPMDYRIWTLLQQKVYEGFPKFQSEASLKEALIHAWDKIDVKTVYRCIMGAHGFRARLQEVVMQNGGHIETKFRKV
jgi:hypothetical protein